MDNYELICQIGKGNFGSISKIIRKSDQKVLVWKELDYGQMSEKEKQQIVSITLSEEGTQQVNGAQIVEESMSYGRAVGFGMEGIQLVITVDYHKCGSHLPFDVVEKMMEVIAGAKKVNQ